MLEVAEKHRHSPEEIRSMMLEWLAEIGVFLAAGAVVCVVFAAVWMVFFAG